jgi:hypothetical protein
MAVGQDLSFELAPDQRGVPLVGDERLPGVLSGQTIGRSQLPSREVARADVPHLANAYEVVEGGQPSAYRAREIMAGFAAASGIAVGTNASRARCSG